MTQTRLPVPLPLAALALALSLASAAPCAQPTFEPHHGHDLVNIGHDSDLPAGEYADSVVAIGGSSNAAGDATQVVAVFGDTHVTGAVEESAVAVFGSTFVDGAVAGDVVAVLGNVRLGADASVGGDVIAVGGTVQRDPGSMVAGRVQTVAAGFSGFTWFKPWVDHCLLYGRPLALAPGLGWAWGLALGLLALYVGLALLFRGGVLACVRTLETQPGMSLLAALLTVLLTPILIVLLCITFVGIAAVPFLAAVLLCTGLFGKVVMLAWLGHRAMGAAGAGAAGADRPERLALQVLIGGLVVLVLYLVPVAGFLVYKLLGLFGLGAVVYTLVLLARERRTAHRAELAMGAGGAATLGMAATGTPPAAAATVPPDAAAAPNAVPPAAAAGPARAPLPAAELPRAGFWVRMAALLLDVLLVGFVLGVLHNGFHLEMLALGFYGAVMWKLRGSTVGGIVFDLQVVRLDDRPVDWETAIVRALGCFLSLAVAGLGFFWIAFDAGKQAWHDKFAGTVVVRVHKGVPLV